MNQFVLFTNQYGSDMFISDSEKTTIPVTDTITEALTFDYRDNPDTKLSYYKALTGYKLQIKYI
jgi:hypothetical protein